MQPDVVMLNEIEKYTSWGNQNQPEVYKSLLQSKTGKTWYYVFAQEFGAWSSNGKGNLILSTVRSRRPTATSWCTTPIAASPKASSRGDGRRHHADLNAPRSLLAVAAPDAGHRGHDVGGGRAREQDPHGRHERVARPDLDRAAQQVYYDSWAVAASQRARPSRSPATTARQERPHRLHLLFEGRGELSVKSSQVYDTRDANGVMPSDHRPVLTTFTVQ